jgi:hypothetical protein
VAHRIGALALLVFSVVLPFAKASAGPEDGLELPPAFAAKRAPAAWSRICLKLVPHDPRTEREAVRRETSLCLQAWGEVTVFSGGFVGNTYVDARATEAELAAVRAAYGHADLAALQGLGGFARADQGDKDTRVSLLFAYEIGDPYREIETTQPRLEAAKAAAGPALLEALLAIVRRVEADAAATRATKDYEELTLKRTVADPADPLGNVTAVKLQRDGSFVVTHQVDKVKDKPVYEGRATQDETAAAFAAAREARLGDHEGDFGDIDAQVSMQLAATRVNDVHDYVFGEPRNLRESSRTAKLVAILERLLARADASPAPRATRARGVTGVVEETARVDRPVTSSPGSRRP